MDFLFGLYIFIFCGCGLDLGQFYFCGCGLWPKKDTRFILDHGRIHEMDKHGHIYKRNRMYKCLFIEISRKFLYIFHHSRQASIFRHLF